MLLPLALAWLLSGLALLGSAWTGLRLLSSARLGSASLGGACDARGVNSEAVSSTGCGATGPPRLAAWGPDGIASRGFTTSTLGETAVEWESEAVEL